MPLTCDLRCAQDAKVDKGTIHDIVLVGGSTRIPKVQAMLQDFFNGKVCAESQPATAGCCWSTQASAAVVCGWHLLDCLCHRFLHHWGNLMRNTAACRSWPKTSTQMRLSHTARRCRQPSSPARHPLRCAVSDEGHVESHDRLSCAAQWHAAHRAECHRVLQQQGTLLLPESTPMTTTECHRVLQRPCSSEGFLPATDTPSLGW